MSSSSRRSGNLLHNFTLPALWSKVNEMEKNYKTQELIAVRRRISQEATRKSHRKSDEEILEIKGLMKEMLERAISERKHLRDEFPARNHVLQRQTCRGTVSIGKQLQ